MASKILFICNSLNQTSAMHNIYVQMRECTGYFTPYFRDDYQNRCSGNVSNVQTPSINKLNNETINYLIANNLNIDFRGNLFHYDIVFSFNDYVIPKNIISNQFICLKEHLLI